ncbi:HVA22-like protein k isoform X2 [Cajanus cajan]|uniref:HVA22-like protein k isoform X2 n=1 Tax=Cajanus cajan TaxID=3821 RepID=UPI0010FBAD31|nr:HVA22-like protein k isoform X2 [Cajanus cajan]
MALPEIGLKLLLSSVNSSIVARAACCSIGLALPVYSTFKAIENNDPYQQQRCLLYWAAYGSFSAAEMYAENLLSWIPFYYHLKLAFLVWLQLPAINSKIVSGYQAELQFAKTLVVKVLMTATQMIRNLIHPVGRESNRIEPFKRQVLDSESEDD